MFVFILASDSALTRDFIFCVISFRLLYFSPLQAVKSYISPPVSSDTERLITVVISVHSICKKTTNVIIVASNMIDDAKKQDEKQRNLLSILCERHEVCQCRAARCSLYT